MHMGGGRSRQRRSYQAPARNSPAAAAHGTEHARAGDHHRHLYISFGARMTLRTLPWASPVSALTASRRTWVAALALGLGCAVSRSGSNAPPPQTELPAARTSLTNGLAPAKCMDVSGASTTPGTRVILFPCNDTDAQKFVWRENGELRYAGTLCLGVDHEVEPGQGAIVTQECKGGADQRWRRGGGSEIIGPSGQCIDVIGGNTADGTPLILAPCTGGESQMWRERAG